MLDPGTVSDAYYEWVNQEEVGMSLFKKDDDQIAKTSFQAGVKWAESQLNGVTPLPEDLQQKVDIIHKAMDGIV